MDADDRKELEAAKLAQIEEEGGKESSDDGDADDDDEDSDFDDPDEDLNF